MNATVTPIQSSAKRPMHVYIKGKIEAARRYENNWFTRIITPAADSYSRPSVVEVRSKAKLGTVGEEVDTDCTLGGYTRKAFRSTDKESGEITMITPVDLTLNAVE